ncbi:2-C-methyl-D-erythritol 4-phosphate cytidylyltransferase [Endomicrobium proavitum]|uniref:2-C-methyl-D-erythritol 4-phosphate cytidylyltransferase n=1 Tax=Endomicrobium proavitum TaxID=1408281 RepID=A0A0G3WM98_9BACT|nr:2-C-methyl-D-erythritol 4-phosphate cytidylyltransferase [Endomicrobium proavitum]AKL98604.1 2-C-methyl-D-erythritol 4-phosphate cytidylyltransferase [Endomicrobium proavitum]
MKATAIIVAGGSGKRFGSKTPKQFLSLCGKPVFLWSAETFASSKVFKRIIIVVPENKITALKKKYKDYFFVSGGKERFDSVRNGLACVEKDTNYVAVHDAARPLINKADILAVLKKAKKTKAAIAVEKTKDTIKTVKSGFVDKTLDRSVLYNVQTPQIFQAALLKKVYSKKIAPNTTDDSMLVEKSGVKVAVVQTKFPNFKITAKHDFEAAEKILTR